jgi:aminoglycoside phosphotransferase (APT) family kinase protein
MLTCALTDEAAAAHALPAGEWHLARIAPRGEGHALLQYQHSEGKLAVGQWFAEQGEYARAVRALTRAGAKGVIPFPAQQIVWQQGGVDTKLPGLAPLCQAGGELVVHHPTRRGVVRQLSSDAADIAQLDERDESTEVRYHKVVRPTRAAALATTMKVVQHEAARIGFNTPAVIATDADAGVVTMAALPGQNLLDVLMDEAKYTEEEVVECGVRAGEVLAQLHRSTLQCEAQHDAAAEGEVVQAWLRRLAWVAPSLHAQVAHHAPRLLTALGSDRSAPVPLHRDCYDKQFVVGRQGVGLLDFDTLAYGEAALDVANFLVHCQLRDSKAVTTTARATRLAYAFLEGYQPPRALLTRLAAYADSTRLRLVCVYGCRPTQHCVATRLAATLGQPLKFL